MTGISTPPSIQDLIESGALRVPARVWGAFRGNKIEAIINSDGNFEYRSKIYSSPSVAAGRAITLICGAKPPSREYFSINDWKFWRVEISSNPGVSLADIRRKHMSKYK